jgi:hypothetical protein
MEHLLSTEIPSDRGLFRTVPRILMGAILDGSDECERSLPRIGVLRKVDLPQELTADWKQFPESPPFHRNRYSPQKPSGKGGILDRDLRLEGKQFSDS